jgi:hypothetical protein
MLAVVLAQGKLPGVMAVGMLDNIALRNVPLQL